MKPTASVIILNWNGRRFLESCLSSVLRQTYRDYEVVLLDNGSNDGSVEFVRERFPEVRVIRSDRNLGFAEGNNRAIKATAGGYIATLNNDTEVEPGWLQALVEAIESTDRVGMCASKVLYADRPDLIDSAGIYPGWSGTMWNRWHGERDECNISTPIEVFGPCAAAALYRREMLEEIGPFDEAFFAYLEDADLAWRARLAGWKCLYVPAARVYHVHSATGGINPKVKRYLLARNKIWMIAKNYPAPQILLCLPLIVLFDLASLLYNLCLTRDLAALTGRLAGVAGLVPISRKRRQVQRSKVVPFSTVAKLFKPFPNP